MLRKHVFNVIIAERDYQNQKWGKLDGAWMEGDWLELLNQYVMRAKTEFVLMPHAQNMERYRKNLIAIATIAVSALEHMTSPPAEWRGKQIIEDLEK